MNHSLSKNRLPLALIVALLVPWLAVHAAPVTISTPFMNLENRAVNSLGFSAGQFLRIGANTVLPNGDGGTTGVGTTTNLGTGSAVSRTIFFTPGPITPNFFARYLTDNPALYGPWNLTFTNSSGGNTHSASTTVSLPANATQAPFVNSITLSGTSLNPTFTWTPPPGALVDGYRLNIFDKALVSSSNSGLVSSRSVQPTQTSYTVTGADFSNPGYQFSADHNYSIEISLIQTKDGTGNLSNANLKAIARVYADFTPTQTGGPNVNLPVTLANGSYQFNMAVAAGQTYYIDPLVAVGYDYDIGAGDPNFRSLDLPDAIGDGLYDIWGFDSGGVAALLAQNWDGHNVFDFGSAGVGKFRVTGIETSAGLNPASTTAFVTGLTFTGSGNFTGTQTPITLDVPAGSVPEPGSVLLVGLALAALPRRRGH